MDEIYIPEEEWDILIILDACRYDIFESTYAKLNFEGELEPRKSKGKNTIEWRKRNFYDTDICSDITYVSGNPQISKWKSKEEWGEIPFNDIIEVWNSHWNEKKNYVPPKGVTDEAKKVYKDRPSDRILVHYLQPHSPYLKTTIGNKGRGQIWAYETEKNKERKNFKDLPDQRGTIFHAVTKGEVTIKELRTGYFKTFLVVMNEVKKLIDHFKIDENVIISSDHGELMGFEKDDGLLGHGENMENINLITVPWFRVDKEMMRND